MSPLMHAPHGNAERELIQRLRSAGAIEPGRALRIPEPSRVESLRLQRLVDAGAVRETQGGYWLDEAVLGVMLRGRDRKKLIALGLWIAAVAAAIGLIR